MADNADRRIPIRESSGVLKRGLNDSQLATIHTLERFGWDLKFVRREGDDRKMVVLFDPDARKYAVIDAEGELDENPIFQKFR